MIMYKNVVLQGIRWLRHQMLPTELFLAYKDRKSSPGILSLRGNNDLVRWSFFDKQIVLYFTVRNDSFVGYHFATMNTERS